MSILQKTVTWTSTGLLMIFMVGTFVFSAHQIPILAFFRGWESGVAGVLALYTILASLRVYYLAMEYHQPGAYLCIGVFMLTGIAAGSGFFYIYHSMFYPTFFLESMPKFSAYYAIILIFIIALSAGSSKSKN